MIPERLKELIDKKVLTTDEYAEARSAQNGLIHYLENLNFNTGEDYILFKWGTLKGWDLNSKKGKILTEKYYKLSRSMSAMQQEDTDRQKEIILEMIDECNGSIQNDWSGEYFTKEEAKRYILEY